MKPKPLGAMTFHFSHESSRLRDAPDDLPYV